MSFKLPADMKLQLLPDEACEQGALHAALNGGEDKPWCRTSSRRATPRRVLAGGSRPRPREG
jgi:hypothetical protein